MNPNMDRNSAIRLLLPGILIATVWGLGNGVAASQGRGYLHGFENGNLIANWSFESAGQTWDANAKAAGFTVDPRFKMNSQGGTNKAISGSFVGKITGTATSTNSAGNFSFYTPYCPISPNISFYTISMYVRSNGVNGTVKPSIRFYSEKDNPASMLGSAQGSPYGNNADWTLYQFGFQPPTGAGWFQLALSETYTSGVGGTFYFDDIVLEEYGFTPRSHVQEEVDFLDALGRSYQGQSYQAGSKVPPYPNMAYSARIRINTTSGGADVTDNLPEFPLLVRLTSTNFNFSQARPNGEDIRFSDKMGNPLSYEIETWNQSAQSASIWIKVPFIEGNKADNDIFMLWGNSLQANASDGPGVFGSWEGFQDVFHLTSYVNTPNPDGSSFYKGLINSTTGANGVEMYENLGVPPQFPSTPWGKGLDFANGITFWDEWPKFGPTDQIVSRFTFSAWMKLKSVPFNCYGVFSFGNTQRKLYMLNGKLTFEDQRGNQIFRYEIANPLPADNTTWKHVAVSYDQAGDATFVINGQIISATKSIQASPFLPDDNMGIGTGDVVLDDSPIRFDGIMDEVRFESAARSPGWLKMGYQNQKSGSSIVTIANGIRPDQPQSSVSGSVTYDKFGRTERTYLPCLSSTSDLSNPGDPTNCAAIPDMPNMGGYNYSQGVYDNQPGEKALEVGSPGAANRVGSGHSVKSDYYYTSGLGIPANIETPATATVADTLYKLKWIKDPEGNYELAWLNRIGQTIQTARNVDRAGATPNLWSWNIAVTEFFRNGSPKRLRTPLDVVAQNNTYSEVFAYNTAGEKTAHYSPDRGLVKYWRDRSGRLRFVQDQGQRDGSGFTFRDYDQQGRFISKGTLSLTGEMDQAIADQDAFVGGSKYEKIGVIYDDLSTFQTRTGIPLSAAMPDAYAMKSQFLAPRYGFGEIICKYNRNADSPLPGFSAADKLVAEFFLHNPDGTLARAFKYFGPVRVADQRYQEVVYQYDEAGRISNETIYTNALTGTISSYHGYDYDDRGRLKKVSGNYGTEPIAEMTYTGWGPLKSVVLGGDGTGGKGTKIEYSYHPLGGISELRATQLGAGKILFQEFLGYDGKANGNSKVPATTGRFSGNITQQLYKFADDVNSLRSVRVVNYKFDELGRMLSADYQQNQAGNPLNPDGSINFSAFSFEDSPANDTYMAYDANGRIASQKTGGVSNPANYSYKSNSYKLDHLSGPVSPTSSRNMTGGGTFVYNSRGALTRDNSKDLSITVDWNLMPVLFVKNAVTQPNDYVEQYCFYDADENRVDAINATVAAGSRNWYYGKHYFMVNGKPYKEFQEQYFGSLSSIDYTVETQNLLGPGLVGRKNRGDTEYYLMNHSGSMMMTVNQDGNVPAQGRVVNDYLAFGDRRKLIDNGAGEPVTPSYTGKEYEDLYGLYYFGARYYDAEIAIWGSPDPHNQFLSPYAFGPDGINGVDEEGTDWLKFEGASLSWYAGLQGDESVRKHFYTGYAGGEGAGALPNGEYRIDVTPPVREATVTDDGMDLKPSTSGIESIPEGMDRWGTYRIRLNKVRVKSDRDNFYIHNPTDCAENGYATHGCIGVTDVEGYFFKDLISWREKEDGQQMKVIVTGKCWNSKSGLLKSSSAGGECDEDDNQDDGDGGSKGSDNNGPPAKHFTIKGFLEPFSEPYQGPDASEVFANFAKCQIPFKCMDLSSNATRTFHHYIGKHAILATEEALTFAASTAFHPVNTAKRVIKKTTGFISRHLPW